MAQNINWTEPYCFRGEILTRNNKHKTHSSENRVRDQHDNGSDDVENDEEEEEVSDIFPVDTALVGNGVAHHDQACPPTIAVECK